MKLLKGKGEKTENKRVHLFIVPIIVMLMLICITAMYIVGATIGRPTETAELNKDVEQEEHISAATDIAATNIGTNSNVLATFTVSTGEIHIYSKNESSPGTINKTNWYNFLKKIVTADSNLDAVKSITFDNEVYAPADSSRLFYPLISSTDYPLTQLATINNLNYLNLYKATSVSSMFAKCSSLERINSLYFNKNTVCVYANDMFTGCSKLLSVDSDTRLTSLVYAERIFKNCSSLKELDLSYWSGSDSTQYYDAFSGCSSLKRVDFTSVERENLYGQ